MHRITDDSLVLEAGGARLEIRPQDGGRIRSLTVDGIELLITEGYGPIMWGCYPMAPWAGRIRDGRFTFRGRDVQLPLTMPPHAIHGTVFDRPWQVTGPASLAIDLGPDWPFPGRLTQTFELADDRLDDPAPTGRRGRDARRHGLASVVPAPPRDARRPHVRPGRSRLPAGHDVRPRRRRHRDRRDDRADATALGRLLHRCRRRRHA